MPDTVAIRRATLDDLPQILERWSELIAHHQSVHPDLFVLAPHARGTYGAFLRTQMANRSSLVLVASLGVPLGTHGVRLIDGFLSGAFGQRAPHFVERDVGMIFDVAVRPEARGHGIGQQLVAEAERIFSKRGIKWLQADYAPSNDSAARFWQADGLKPLLVGGYRPVSKR